MTKAAQPHFVMDIAIIQDIAAFDNGFLSQFIMTNLSKNRPRAISVPSSNLRG